METLLKYNREEAENTESESPSEEEEEIPSESSDEEEEPVPAVRSYAALMQTFAAESGPQAKRRKLDHVPEPKPVEDEVEDETLNADGKDVDEVEEPEEGPEAATDGALEDEDDNEDESDPFQTHFAAPDDNVLAQRLKALGLNQWTTQKFPLNKGSKAVVSMPDIKDFNNFAHTVISGPSELKLKQKLANVMGKKRPKFDPLEKAIASLIFNYQDVLYCERSTANAESLRRLTCLHAVNHVFK